jgi:hypothetical protein
VGVVPAYPLTSPAVVTFILIPLALAVGLIYATAAAWRRSAAPRAETRRVAAIVAALAAVWMTITWIAAARGWLLDFTSTPPAFAWLVLGIVALGVALPFSPLGRRLAAQIPLWVLVGVQGFRLPLEIAMHRLAERGVMPEQMSYSGRNFDILTGLTAILVAALVRSGYGGRRLVAVWNVAGLALLVNIVAVAIVSTPRFAWFGPDRLNVFVMYPPFVWLPAVMVLAALAGHLIVFRALRQEGR